MLARVGAVLTMVAVALAIVAIAAAAALARTDLNLFRSTPLLALALGLSGIGPLLIAIAGGHPFDDVETRLGRCPLCPIVGRLGLAGMAGGLLAFAMIVVIDFSVPSGDPARLLGVGLFYLGFPLLAGGAMGAGLALLIAKGPRRLIGFALVVGPICAVAGASPDLEPVRIAGLELTLVAVGCVAVLVLTGNASGPNPGR